MNRKTLLVEMMKVANSLDKSVKFQKEAAVITEMMEKIAQDDGGWEYNDSDLGGSDIDNWEEEQVFQDNLREEDDEEEDDEDDTEEDFGVDI